MLEVDQAAKVGGQLLQLILTQVQLHQVCEAAEIRLGPGQGTPKPLTPTSAGDARALQVEGAVHKPSPSPPLALPPASRCSPHPALPA